MSMGRTHLYSLMWSWVWLECAIRRWCKDEKIKSLPSRRLCLKRRQMFRVMEYSHYWDHEKHSKHREWESGKPSRWSNGVRGNSTEKVKWAGFEVRKGVCQGWNNPGRGNSTHRGQNARKACQPWGGGERARLIKRFLCESGKVDLTRGKEVKRLYLLIRKCFSCTRQERMRLKSTEQ